MPFEMTQEELKMIETRWKSDVDKKLDTLINAEREHREKYGVFIEMLMKREVDAAALRRAVMEKTLAGLIWMVVVGLVSLVWSGTRHEFSEFVNAWKSIK